MWYHTVRTSMSLRPTRGIWVSYTLPYTTIFFVQVGAPCIARPDQTMKKSRRIFSCNSLLLILFFSRKNRISSRLLHVRILRSDADTRPNAKQCNAMQRVAMRRNAMTKTTATGMTRTMIRQDDTTNNRAPPW